MNQHVIGEQKHQAVGMQISKLDVLIVTTGPSKRWTQTWPGDVVMVGLAVDQYRRQPDIREAFVRDALAQHTSGRVPVCGKPGVRRRLPLSTFRWLPRGNVPQGQVDRSDGLFQRTSAATRRPQGIQHI